MRAFLTLHHPRHTKAFYDQGLWRTETFYGLLARHAVDRPSAKAIQDGGRVLTWLELREWVDGVGAAFRSRGLAEGDCVSIWMSNRIESVVTCLACSREGLVCNPSLHRTYSSQQVTRMLEWLPAQALVTEEGYGSDFIKADSDAIRAELTHLKVVYTPETFPQAGHNTRQPCNDPDRVAYLAFTSGTAGVPKCVMHSQNTLLANARDLVRDWVVGPDLVVLVLSPLSHHMAWGFVAQMLLSGCCLILNDPRADASAFDTIVTSGATFVVGVPTHAIDILAEQKRRGLPLGCVKVFCMAGSPIPPSVADAFLSQGIMPLNVYGMTENSSHQYTHPTDDARTLVSSCGRGGAAYEIRVFDTADCNRPLDTGKVGQIGGRGAALMLGYFGNQSATAASFNVDGWFMSGDLGVIDREGNLHVEGRLKDIIVRGGRKIYPVFIETAIMQHPEVSMATCFPVADDRLGERMCLAVIGTIQAEDALAHLAINGVSLFDMPEYFIRVDSFPLTESGKILKRALVEMVDRGDLRPERIRYPGNQLNRLG